MALIHCIYASIASNPIADAEVRTLLERARVKNAALGITGMLLFIEGSFFQVLEGEASAVDTVYATITKDARHDRVTPIIRETIARRSFEEWSMGFAELNREEAVQVVGANDFFASASCLERINAGRAKKLLMAFGAGRWRMEQTGVHRAHPRVA